MNQVHDEGLNIAIEFSVYRVRLEQNYQKGLLF